MGAVALTAGGSLTKEGRNRALELLSEAAAELEDEELVAEIEDFLDRFESGT